MIKVYYFLQYILLKYMTNEEAETEKYQKKKIEARL